jgi:hypothetical protein
MATVTTPTPRQTTTTVPTAHHRGHNHDAGPRPPHPPRRTTTTLPTRATTPGHAHRAPPRRTMTTTPTVHHQGHHAGPRHLTHHAGRPRRCPPGPQRRATPTARHHPGQRRQRRPRPRCTARATTPGHDHDAGPRRPRPPRRMTTTMPTPPTLLVHSTAQCYCRSIM